MAFYSMLVFTCLLVSRMPSAEGILIGTNQQESVSNQPKEPSMTKKVSSKAASRGDNYEEGNSHNYPVYQHQAEGGYGGVGGLSGQGGGYGGSGGIGGISGQGGGYGGSGGIGGLSGQGGGYAGLGAGGFGGHSSEGGGYGGEPSYVGGGFTNGLENSYPHIPSHPQIPSSFHHDHHISQHHHENGHHKALAIKGLLVPLAGVALLGAAAALVSNPILLQLGVISGKRRRRDAQQYTAEETDAVQRKLDDIALLEKFIAQVPKEQAMVQEKQLLASYLMCSNPGASNKSASDCVERLACELRHPNSEASQLDRHVMNIVTSEILANEYVPPSLKERVRIAGEIGNAAGDCSTFPCNDLENNSS